MCPAVPPYGKERGDSVFVFPQRFNTSDAPELCPDEVHLSALMGGALRFRCAAPPFLALMRGSCRSVPCLKGRLIVLAFRTLYPLSRGVKTIYVVQLRDCK